MSRVVLCAMPKSGSSYLTRYLYNGLGLDHDAPPRPAGAFPACHLEDRHVTEIARRSGFVWQVHFAPTPSNMEKLLEGGATRVVAHMRDPRQATVSWAHHARKLRVAAYGNDDAFYVLPFDEQLDAAVHAHFPVLCDWAAAWLQRWVVTGPRHVLLTDYDELHASPAALARRICAFYGEQFDEVAAVNVPRGDFYRRGEREEWRRVLTRAQQEWCWGQMEAKGLTSRWPA